MPPFQYYFNTWCTNTQSIWNLFNAIDPAAKLSGRLMLCFRGHPSWSILTSKQPRSKHYQHGYEIRTLGKWKLLGFNLPTEIYLISVKQKILKMYYKSKISHILFSENKWESNVIAVLTVPKSRLLQTPKISIWSTIQITIII